MMYLRIHGDPVRTYFDDVEVLALLDVATARHQLLHQVGAIVSAVDGDNANVTVALREGAQTSALMAVPPLGAAATLWFGGSDFVGVVRSVGLGADGCVLSVAA